jgi:hypothetical protein
MRIISSAVLIPCFLAASHAVAATYYLDGSVASSGNGQSWATAWKTFGNISGLHAGDIVYISGGSNGMTYNTGEFLSASGTSGNPITYKVSTDAGKNGVVTINCSGGSQFIYASPSQGYGQWITFDGNVNGSRNLTIQGWTTPVTASNSVGIVFRYVTLTNVAASNHNSPLLRMDGSSHIEIDHCLLDLASGNDHAIFGIGTGAANYTENLIHDSIIRLRYMRGNGWGDDGFQWISSTSIYNNQFLGVYDGAYPWNQHQDGLQTAGPYLAIWGNYFENMQNYPIYGDAVGGTPIQHIRIYNNVFYQPDTTGSQAVSIGCDGGVTCAQSDIIVANNTIVSSAHCIFVNQGTPGALSATYVENNICYNAGEILVSTATQSNNVTSTAGITFMNPTSDFHLQSTSTAAIGKGMSPSYLTSVYTTDKDGMPRGTAWDIGAYQYNSSATSAPPPVTLSPPSNLTVTVH